MPPAAAPFQLRRFNPGFDALGIVADFVTRTPPLDRAEAGTLITALKYQIAHAHHVAAFAGERLVGYCGWLPIESGQARAWLDGTGDLVPSPPGRADAVALTIVRVDERAALMLLIRAARRIEAGKHVFFRRDYESGRPQRRSRVLNMTGRAGARP